MCSVLGTKMKLMKVTYLREQHFLARVGGLPNGSESRPQLGVRRLPRGRGGGMCDRRRVGALGRGGRAFVRGGNLRGQRFEFGRVRSAALRGVGFKSGHIGAERGHGALARRDLGRQFGFARTRCGGGLFGVLLRIRKGLMGCNECGIGSGKCGGAIGERGACGDEVGGEGGGLVAQLGGNLTRERMRVHTRKQRWSDSWRENEKKRRKLVEVRA